MKRLHDIKLNSLLVLAVVKSITAARTGVKAAIEEVRAWDLLFAFHLSTEKTYLVPEGRAPPVTMFRMPPGARLALRASIVSAVEPK